MENNENKKYKFLTIILLSVVFGLGAGIVGNIISQSYITNDIFSLPFYGEVNLLNNRDRFGSSLVIRNPKNVIVEQNTKIKEVVTDVEKSIVGIYDKKAIASSSTQVKQDILESFYNLKEKKGSGLVITNDGWILVDFSPANLLSTTTIADKENKKIAEKFVIIDVNKKLYQVKSIIPIKNSQYSFFKIESKDLIVKEFVIPENIEKGELIITLDADNEVDLAWIKDILVDNKKLVRFSDETETNLVFTKDYNNLNQSFFFRLDGGILALRDNGKIKTIDNYLEVINNLFKKETKKLAKLGIYYISLNDLLPLSGVKEKGALIHKNEKDFSVLPDSVAFKSGLKEGDVIISVDSVELNETNDLANILKKYKVGDEVLLEYLRNDKKSELKIAF